MPAAAQPLPGTDDHLRVVGVTRSFGNVEALRGVDFAARRGEVMALVGDNGAGKSTLMKILAGAESLDSGFIFLAGKQVEISNPHVAAENGISIVYQDLALCENMDIVSNMFLGDEAVKRNSLTRLSPNALRPLDELEMERQAKDVIGRLRVRTLQTLRTKVASLSGGQRQAVAIARALDKSSSVVLLDEPTAALGVAQTRQVLDLVKSLRDSDHAVVYISHNLKDVFEVSDRITALRHGKAVGVYERSETTHEEVVAAITGGAEADE